MKSPVSLVYFLVMSVAHAHLFSPTMAASHRVATFLMASALQRWWSSHTTAPPLDRINLTKREILLIAFGFKERSVKNKRVPFPRRGVILRMTFSKSLCE